MTRSTRTLACLAALALVLAAAACASAPPRKAAPRPAPVPPAPVAPIAPPPAPPSSGDAKFDVFLAEARVTALAQGISGATFDSAIAGIAPDARILGMNANQPEFTKPVWSYLDTAVSERRIADGRFLRTRHADVLERIAAQSGVPAEILMAVWGMETDYGADTGSFNLFTALATLAYDGPRTAFAKPEFFAALQIYQQQNYAVGQMTASWAGAFGQTQFTPTTFLKHAVDGDGDGRIDLWRSVPDALASAARLLAQQGWQPGKSWGYEVKLPDGFAYEKADTETRKTISQWQAQRVTMVDGSALPASDEGAAIYLPAGARGPAFLVFANFHVLLKYNNAASYALAVGLLADRIAGAGPVKQEWPRGERALSRNERMQFQTNLQKLGFDPGAPDGVLGRRSRAALRLYQKSKALAADGFATAALLAMLETDAAARQPRDGTIFSNER